MFNPRKPIECMDGFTMSVQASSYHYCTPRCDDAPFYTSYEVGYPSAREELLLPHMESWKEDHDPTDAVYPCVPVELIAEVIRKHGGLK